MGLYQGRALRTESPRPRPTRGRRVMRIVKAMGVIAMLAGIAQLPWSTWRARFAVISEVRVAGAEYLDADRIAKLAGIKIGGDLFLDFERARQELLLHARIAEAEVKRRGLRGVAIRITERRPVLLVHHGVPWELDSAGVLLAPFTAAGITPEALVPEGFKVEAMAAIGKPADASVLPEALREREAPSDRRKLDQTICEGPFCF